MTRLTASIAVATALGVLGIGLLTREWFASPGRISPNRTPAGELTHEPPRRLAPTPALARPPTLPESPFWAAAVVPEPESVRAPTAAVVPGSAGGRRDYAAEVRALAARPASPENVRALNGALTVWFEQDPRAVAGFLSGNPRFAEFTPAVVSIAASIAERGDLDTALKWLDAVPDGDAREAALIGIYNLEARLGRISRADAAAAGFTPAEIERIFLLD